MLIGLYNDRNEKCNAPVESQLSPAEHSICEFKCWRIFENFRELVGNWERLLCAWMGSGDEWELQRGNFP